MARRAILIAVIGVWYCLCPFDGAAQEPEPQKSRERMEVVLSKPDSINRTTVTVRVNGVAGEAVRAVEAIPAPAAIRGFRVQIFADNGQYARDNATAAVERFKELFPGVPVYQAYDIPTFKVFVGNCLTKEEAIILCAKVIQSFDRAFVAQMDIPVEELAE